MREKNDSALFVQASAVPSAIFAADGGDGGCFALEYERQRLAVALTHDGNDLALTGLILGPATVATVLSVVTRLHAAAKIGAVDLDLTGQGALVSIGRNGLADLVRHDEGRLVLHVQIAGELQGTIALGAVDEDRDSQEVIADRQLAAGEDGPARNGKLMAAGLALPQLASLVGVNSGAIATRANGLALRCGPANKPKGVEHGVTTQR